ncbi:DNA topoisomerase II [Fistulifera solaris]|uniref:DNA topoisomerase 2 n=1 Tax=Fistulifera solaris TaxID=1519565 RepID=A0A1Z5J9F6_FISSO|nr:DNA topoisomerase II [Fistulifera solaris]|eukprot:GAX10586.1 DNA topoisomerase II [Fistulifera solaris]
MASSDEEMYDTSFDEDAENIKPTVVKKNPAGKKTVEEIYQKKTQLEHILARPDTYIGSTEPQTQTMYVLQGERIVEREITYTPGLYKIFDEIVVNAADNKQRDPNMDKMEIHIDAATNQVSVLNNGAGIPIVMHKEHNCYVPTLIFGHLLTGSNFDDDEKKTTGGRNGYGAKLANVFSTQFIVECAHVETGLYFRQVFRNNMSQAEAPTVQKLTKAQEKQGDFVKITFSPDLAKFKMTHLDPDTVGLFAKRAYDIAGAMSSAHGKKLNVSLNGNKLAIKNFKDYLEIFEGIEKPVAYEKNERWEVGVGPSPDQTPKQISFVNSICTSKGGQHVSYIADQVAAHLQKVLKKKNKGTEFKPAQIKNNMMIFVNCLIENPAFDSQTKEFMTTRPKQFGSEFKVSEKFLKAVEKSEIVDMILIQNEKKEAVKLKRKGGVKKSKLTGIPKLDDANHAGTAKSRDCTLIITEGDSAKSLAMSGLSVVGRDYYGVFPLRGKLLNVRDVTKTVVGKNVEIQHLVDILGLKYETVYDENSIKTLRYGHLMIMTDQDVDGSHIKGLVINFIHKFWPSLLNIPGFLQQFITPIVKVSKGKKSQAFYNLREYENWMKATGNNGKGYTIKYYKGLGTSTSAEAKEYFSNLPQHKIWFQEMKKDEGIEMDDSDDAMEEVLPDVLRSSGSDLIDMVFRKDRVEERKTWLMAVDRESYLDFSVASNKGGVKYSEFINKEYCHFSLYDNERSIPCLVDGFKPSQRKVLYACFKRKLKGEVKVAQLTGYIAEHSAYHHGEASLQGTIVNMAQDFVGSNNINLLTPAGQFGTRLMGGKDAASPRYIFTRLEPITRTIFHPDDDELLNYRLDDGMTIEPDFYVPVIPMVLVNGADGIGTGWSTNVANYNPRDIIDNLRRYIAGEEMEEMAPFYSGFSGEIAPKGTNGYEVRGKIERIDDATILITELPVKKWTQDYKVFVEGLLTGDGKTPAEIKDFRENHTDTTVSFTIIAEKAMIDKWESEKGGLMNKFKLTASLSTNNMNLFDENGKITKYESPLSIMRAFVPIRLEYYEKRKENLVSKLEEERKILSNKARFVEEVCSGKLVVSNRKRNDILNNLKASGYDLVLKYAAPKDDEDSQDEEVEEESTVGELAKGYEYLLGMKIWSLTYEKAEALRAQLAEKTQELEILKKTAPAQIWSNDLDAIEAALDERDGEISKALATEKKAQQKSRQIQAKAVKKSAAKAKGVSKKDDWDSDMESSDDEIAESDSDVEMVQPKKLSRPVTAAKKPAASLKQTKISGALLSKPSAPVQEETVPVAAAPKKSILDNDSDDDLVTLSLAERMAKKLTVSPPKKSSAPSQMKVATKPSVLEIEKVENKPDSPLAHLDDMKQRPSVPKITKVVQVSKKQETALKPHNRPTKSAAPAKKPAVTKKAAPKRKVVESDDSESEDDFAFDESDEEVVVEKVNAAPAARNRRARPAVTYQVDSDDDDESFA